MGKNFLVTQFFWRLFVFCLFRIIRIPFLSVARIKDDLLLSSSRLITIFLIIFALTTIFYSIKLFFVYRFSYIVIFFRRRLFFRCFLVFFGVFFDLNLSISIFFDDFLAVYSLILLRFSFSYLKSMIFCYDIF